VDPASVTRAAAILDRGSTLFVGLLWLPSGRKRYHRQRGMQHLR
jgi:hypothetical protein